MSGISSGIFRQTPYFLNFIFDGKLFTMNRKQAVTGNGTVFLMAITGPSRLFHTVSRSHAFQGGGPFTVDLIENPTVTTNGTAFSASNMNRRSNKTTEAQLFDGPTGVTGGTVIDSVFMPSSGVGSQGVATFATPDIERVLKANTRYVLRIVNGSANTSDFQTNILFYESDN